MTHLRRTYLLQCVLITITLLVVGIISSLSVVHWYEEGRRYSQTEWQLRSLAAIHESATTAQDRDLIQASREAILQGIGTVDIWRADKTENSAYDWRQIQSLRGQRPAVVWLVDPNNAQFLDGQYVVNEWRAVQRIVSNQATGDVLIRVYWPREPLMTYLIHRLSEIIFLLPALAALAVGLFIWASSKTIDPWDKLVDELKQVCNDNPVSVPNQHVYFRRFEHLVENINDVLTTIKSQNKRMTSFATETAHELRTPLASMRIIGEIALREPKDEAHLRDCIGAMLEECQNMDQFIEGILLIAHAKSKRVAVSMTPVNLTLLAAEFVDKLAPLAEANGMSLELHVPPEETNRSALTVDCDRTLLRQAGVNLINNAIVHNPPGTQIIVKTESTDKGPRLIISDTGIGFDPHAKEVTLTRKRVAYSPTGKESKRRNLGLGLSIAASLAESQGAQLIIDSNVGSGTRIVLEFSNKLHDTNSSVRNSRQIFERLTEKIAVSITELRSQHTA